MKKIQLLILGLVFALAFSCSDDEAVVFGTAKATKNGASGTITILKDIKVMLYKENASLYSTTTTNDKGEFRFSGIASGNYYIGASIIHEGDTLDTGFLPRSFYVGDKINKEQTLELK